MNYTDPFIKKQIREIAPDLFFAFFILFILLPCGEGFLRISYAYSLENLKIALEKIEKFVERLRREAK